MQGNIVLGFLFSSLVISIISIALPYWYYNEPSDGGVLGGFHFGLWIYCAESAIYSKCESINEDPVYSAVVEHGRIFELIGLLFLVVAALLGALKMSTMKENEIIQRFAGGLAVTAGVLMIFGTVVFAYKILKLFGVWGINGSASELAPLTKLHAGFALAIASGVISFFAGYCFCCIKSTNVTQVRPYPANLQF